MKKGLILFAVLTVALLFAGQDCRAADEGNSLSGKVIETMDSGGYTYVRLQTKTGKIWLAVPQTKVVKGQNMSFIPGAEMENFESKTLKRTFDKIIFSAGPVTKGESASGAASDHQGSKGSVVVSKEKIKIEKASGPNAYTVADIHKKRLQLDKKEVVVRGKVVKVSKAIMGKNWIHLQDGTGSPEAGTQDLVVTSQDLPKVGDVVTAKGVVAKDKDFGSNYKYKVIVENATVKP